MPKKAATRIRRKPRREDDGDLAQSPFPQIGKVLKRLRQQRNLTIREVAEASDLSPSFLSAVERNVSDLSLGRLARLARFFDQDLGTLLGYGTRVNQPTFPPRAFLNRGRGIKYETFRLPGINLELELITFEPRRGFRDSLVHEGLDCVICVDGEVVLEVDGVDYQLPVGECAVYTAAVKHRLRNDGSKPATIVGITTGRMA